MKQKRFNKKLGLNKETIVRLDGEKAADVRGGGPTYAFTYGPYSCVNHNSCFSIPDTGCMIQCD
jgi:hypothetical protein